MKKNHFLLKCKCIIAVVLFFGGLNLITGCTDQNFETEINEMPESVPDTETRSDASLSTLINTRVGEEVLVTMSHSLKEVNFQVLASYGNPVLIWWGDGTYSETSGNIRHTYTDNLDNHDILIIAERESIYHLDSRDIKIDNLVLNYCGGLISCNVNGLEINDCYFLVELYLVNSNIERFETKDDEYLWFGSFVCENSTIRYVSIKQQEYFENFHIIDSNIDTLILSETPIYVADVTNSNFSFFEISDCPGLVWFENYNSTYKDLRLINLERLNDHGFYTNLDLSNHRLESLVLENLPIIDIVDISNNNLKNLSVSNLPSLKEINCSNNNLQSYTFSNVPLFTLDISDNKLTSLNNSQLNNVTNLNCANNLITQIDIRTLTNLKIFNCANNKITALDLSNSSKLTSLNYAYNLIGNINLNQTPNLTNLNCRATGTTTLNLSLIKNLSYLNCADNSITTLSVNQTPDLLQLECQNNLLSQLNFTNNPSINKVFMYGNQFDFNNLISATLSLPNRTGLSQGQLNYGSRNALIDDTLANRNWRNLYQE